MAFERKLAAVPPQAFTSNGTSLGVVTIASTAGFYIKQGVFLQSNTIPSSGFQVKNILSETQLILGPQDNSLNAPLKPTDLSAYLVADDATITAPEQNNFTIKPDDHYLSVYLPAPVSADRVIDVDPYGNPYGPNNPYPVSFDGTITIGDVTVVGTAPNNYPLEPNSDGSINVDLSPLTTFQTEQYSIGTTPVQITPTPMPDRNSIGFKAICTTSTDTIYIGNNAGVTTSTGYPLFTHDTLELDLQGGETIYAVATSSGQTLCVLELGD
jgi:hypothetical protein